MARSSKYSPELRERAVRMVFDHAPEHSSQWATMRSVADDRCGPAVMDLVHHSDRGTQYVSMHDTERLADAGIEPSAGSRGDSYDNALAESVIGLFTTEVIQRNGPWRHLEAVEFATVDWVDWFNTRRLLEPLGYVPPAEYKAQYYEQLQQHAASETVSPPAGGCDRHPPHDVVAGGNTPARTNRRSPFWASDEVELASIRGEFTMVARFAGWRSSASISRHRGSRELRRAPA